MFKNISVKAKILGIVICAIFLTTAISLTDTVVELNKNGNKEIELFKANAFATETQKLKSYVHLALSTMKFFNEKEGLTLEEKKAEAFKAVEKLRYSKTGYYWLNDYNHVVLVHGAKPALAGKSMYNLQDKKGKYLYREIVKAASSSARSGTVDYYWSKPGKEGSHQKLSYVEEFKPWNIIVGTGVYIDEIDAQVNEMKKHIDESISEVILTNLVITLISTTIIIFLVSIIINRIIAKPLKDVETGLEKFFLFLNKQTQSVETLEIRSNDEFGKMSAVINENISKTTELIKEDESLIADVKRVVNEVNKGYIVERVNVSTSNETLEELKVILNTMLDSISNNVSTNINNVTKVLDSFAALDFTKNSKDKGRVAQELNNLSQVISKMLVMNLETSRTLQSNSTTLNDNVQKLSVASNQAAANLEETAAALEEITGNMVSNQENVQKMSSYAEDVTQSVKKGQELANKTVTSMDNINEQVEAIDSAIIIIDQIAFQTNILSLNAAVEAATAGEAGKGFAVVAQEVRNLAARAAEAAKEIKELVENATIKANEGKTIATDMINGYEHLNDSIHSTIELIDSVANSSREQQIGVTQVNDALNQLDKATQQNAAIAAEATQIARNTNDIAQKIVDDTNEKEFIGKV